MNLSDANGCLLSDSSFFIFYFFNFFFIKAFLRFTYKIEIKKGKKTHTHTYIVQIEEYQTKHTHKTLTAIQLPSM